MMRYWTMTLIGSLAAVGCGDTFTSGDGGGTTTGSAGHAATGGGGANASGGGGSAGSGGAGGSGATECGEGTVAEPTDDFEAIALDTSLWKTEVTPQIGTVDASGVRLTVAVHLGSEPPDYRLAYIASVPTYRFTGCAIFVEAIHVPSAANVDMFLGALVPSTNYAVEAVYRDGKLYLWRRDDVNGSSATGGTVYNNIAHKYWRLREEHGMVFAEASGDSVQWDVIASTAWSVNTDDVRVYLGIGAALGGDGASVAKFDNVNVPP